MHYTQPVWLPGGHLQTIVPALWSRKPRLHYRRERWDTPDADFIDVDFIDAAAGQPLVVLFHGLEGSSDSHYARALMAAVQARGWAGAVPHFRGCSGELNRAPRFYHSGDAREIDWILRRLAARASGPVYACGVSLGGNALLRWLGEEGSGAGFVRAACAVSAPLDLAAGGAALSSGFNRLYTRMFLQTLKPKCLAKLQQYPGLFDRQALLAARDLYAFDNVVTAPLHGYRNTDDYWDRASAKHVLPDITVPTLVLNARNDPFLPGVHLPRHASAAVTLDYPEHGGHVGFAVGGLPGRLDWLPQRLLHFLDHA
ncbi:YheT family hydrolase [Massilia sp. TS11]|uniref:YheT family hydrolase n=1 Tax=Massilia sp. TS11 TaxID=2908003 RepID=UPI001EDC5724|nr:alpha/beta fold hydrolase [Massilia sp. TS11]MCG2586436.1 alpha/beta fold hydrolase [Massilia sp. TS11]